MELVDIRFEADKPVMVFKQDHSERVTCERVETKEFLDGSKSILEVFSNGSVIAGSYSWDGKWQKLSSQDANDVFELSDDDRVSDFTVIIDGTVTSVTVGTFNRLRAAFTSGDKLKAAV